MESDDMKKCRCLIVAITALCMVLPVSAYAEQEIGKITKLKGTALIYRESAAKPIEAFMGMPVQQRDRITTKADSRVRIELNDGSVLSLGENGDLNLNEFEFDQKEKKRKAFFGVALGKLRVFAMDLLRFREKSFRVNTPTAVVGVRGTVFLVWVKSQTITQVACFDRTVEVANLFKPSEYVVLTKNLATNILKGKTPSRPILMTPDQLYRIQEGLEALKIPETPTEAVTTETTGTEETTTEATTTEATTTQATTTSQTTTTPTTTQATTTRPTTTTTRPTTTTTTTTTTTRPTTTTTTTTTTSTTTTTTMPTTTYPPTQVLPGMPAPPG